MRVPLFAFCHEQSLAQMERELAAALLRPEERLHLGRGLGQHGFEQRLHDGVVAARPAGKLDRFRRRFLVPSPTDETVVAGGVWAIAFRQIAPRCAGSQHPEDAIEDTSIVHTRHATGFVRKEWLDGGPFKVSQPIPHDSRLQFGSLNHVHGGTIKPQRADRGRCHNPDFTSAFRGIAGMAGLAAGSTQSRMTPEADMNAQTVTLFRVLERPRLSRHETWEQADELHYDNRRL